MILNSKLFFSVCFILVFSFGYSQSTKREKNLLLEDLIEEITSNSDEDIDFTTLYDDLNHFLSNPLDLNEAQEADLDKLQFLNDFQIASLLKYREKYGKFQTIYELQLLNGYTGDDIERILPFIKVGKVQDEQAFKLSRALKYGSNQLFVRTQQVIEQQEGYKPISQTELAEKPNSRYLGSKQKLYTRYKYQYKDKIYFGVVAEKDAGEAFLASQVNDALADTLGGRQKNGFDYYSAHLQVNGIGPVKALCLGDFQAQFGQGLVMWTGFGYGKSPYVLNIKKKAQKIRRYSSTDENNFLRGVGTTMAAGPFDVSAFFSSRRIDANIGEVDVTDDEAAYVTSFQTSGLHSTVSELYDKDAIGLTSFGGNVSYSHKNFKIGATYAQYKYGAALQRSASKYNQFDFSGSEHFNVGLDYQFVVKNISFFGEMATCRMGGMAVVNGALFNMAPQIAMSVLHRYYEKDYFSPFGNAFAESKSANENGLYMGTIIFPVKHWKLSAYYDLYSFPWLKSGAYSPSEGQDYFLQADYAPTRNVSMYFRFKNETKEKNLSDDTPSPVDLENYALLKARYHISYQLSKTLEMKNRIEYARYTEDAGVEEEGFMFYQDVIYKPKKVPLSLSFRYAIYNTSYNTRMYAYENDILYAFSIPAYYDKGTRTYLTLKYTIAKGVDIWLRYGQFYYADKDVIGSGLTEIQGKTKSEVKAQVRIKF